jgi:hypothetical protein
MAVEEAATRLEVAERETAAAREALREALREAHRLGASFGQLGEVVGLSRSRVAQLVGGD